MKILFKNTTKYDKENRDNFTNFHQDKYGKREIIGAVLMAIAIMYILIFNIINLNWKFILLLIPIGTLIYFINRYATNKQKEKNKKQKNKEFTFYFYERYIKIKCKRQFERMTYFEIKKVFETNEKFFLYTDDKKSMILDKEGFEIGTSKKFAEFIKKKCPLRYRKEESKQGEK